MFDQSDSSFTATHNPCCDFLQSTPLNPRPVSADELHVMELLREAFDKGAREISLIWIPGHRDIGLNPRADALAGQAYESDDVPPFVHVPGRALKKQAKKLLRKVFSDHLKRAIRPSA